MKKIRFVINVTAILVLALCTIAAIFSGIFMDPGDATYYSFGWYFLAKGLFCSLSLYISGIVIEKLSEIAKNIEKK
jgi:hypothetical protein